jgi:regulatory protein
MPQTAFDKAIRLLARRARTASELERALEKAGVASDARASTLARLRELGYINDAEAARARARTRIDKGDARRLLVKKLEAQGVEASTARAAAVEAAAGVGEEELAARALERRLRGRKPADMREKQRLVRWLAASGHRPSAAAKAVGIEWEGNDETDDL